MGIFGALNTAVTGLAAQSFALENISGNIANSQTTAFKRQDTSFQDFIPDLPPSAQPAGSVLANSRQTINVQGSIQSASIGTFMAINGDGFFVVEKPTSLVGGTPVFDGTQLYTRRADFQTDKDGFLVNGSGYYLMGIPIDAATGNPIGSVPQLLQFQNNFVPPQPTTQITYHANLPSYPKTPTHDVNVARSELLNPGDFIQNPVAPTGTPAQILGYGATLNPDAPAVVTGTASLPANMVNGGVFQINGANVTITAGDTPAQVIADITAAAPPGLVVPPTQNGAGDLVLTSTNATTSIVIAGGPAALMAELGLVDGTTPPTNLLTQGAVSQGQTMVVTIGANPTLTITFGNLAGQVQTMAQLNGANGFAPLVGGTGSVNVANGNVTITATSASDTITVGGSANRLNFGMHTASARPTDQTVRADDLTAFNNETVGGGEVTAYDSLGAAVNVNLRWAKVASAAYGGTDTWNLFYETNTSATGSQVAWQNVGQNFTFGSNGQMNPPITTLSITNFTINGDNLGTITFNIGAGGLTQFADAGGGVQINMLQQNGFAAGSLQSVSVNDRGQIEGTYSNGRTLGLAEVPLAKFNGPNFLQRLDGGGFAQTNSSGPAILGASGKILGSSLESSNVDIADEFTKLIVTQQAYSANTKVITTGNAMVQDLLNMLR